MKKAILISAIFCLVLIGAANAASVEKLKDVPERGDFDLGPTSFEIEANPGEKIIKTIQVTNRKGFNQDFLVGVEDFQGSLDDPEKTVLLQGGKSGIYGAKDWVHPEMEKFQLVHGERQFFDINISIPSNADAGDHYASVLVSAPPKTEVVGDNNDKSKSNVVITSRAGALFFIRVTGDVKEEGLLKSFAVKKEINTESVADFKIIFENKGTVRLQPKGIIKIKDVFGRVVDVVPIDQFNVLRNSFRAVSHRWEPDNFSVGLYKAELELERGYDDLSDSASVSFFVLPMKKLALILGIIILIVTGIYFFRKNIDFKIERKKRK